MKRYLTILAAGLIFFACDNKEKEEEYQNRISELESMQLELQEEVREQENTFMAFMESIAEVEKNLKEIRARESNIELTQQTEDLSPEDLREQISEDIEAIDRLIGENKQTIQNLSVRLRSAGQQNEQLNMTMDERTEELNQQIEERENNLNALKEQLDNAQATIEGLRSDVDSLARLNNEKTIELNTAYYVAGDFKELRDEQILNKEGGFLGFLGRTEVLRDDFNREKFTQIDIREKMSFPIEGEKVELVTAHPTGSYTIENAGEQVNLVVSDPEKFWESSKYLVMMVK